MNEYIADPDSGKRFEQALDEWDETNKVEGVRTGHIYFAVHVSYDADGDSFSSYSMHTPDGQPWITTLGLIEAFRLLRHKEFTAPYQPEE
jgi:hypothetical protein